MAYFNACPVVCSALQFMVGMSVAAFKVSGLDELSSL